MKRFILDKLDITAIFIGLSLSYLYCEVGAIISALVSHVPIGEMTKTDNHEFYLLDTCFDQPGYILAGFVVARVCKGNPILNSISLGALWMILNIGASMGLPHAPSWAVGAAVIFPIPLSLLGVKFSLRRLIAIQISRTKIGYAGFWRRVLAQIIDGAAVTPFLAVLRLLVHDTRIPLVSDLFIYALYFISFESSKLKATPGKSLLNSYVAREDGNVASVPRIIARYIVFISLLIPLLLFEISPAFITLDTSLKKFDAAHDTHAASVFATSTETTRSLIILMACLLLYVVGGLLLFIAPICLTKKKAGLHDYLTKTRVFHLTPESSEVKSVDVDK